MITGSIHNSYHPQTLCADTADAGSMNVNLYVGNVDTKGEHYLTFRHLMY